MTRSLRAEAVLLDLDGVLVDSIADVERHWSAWAARRGLPLQPVLATVHGRPSRDTIAEHAPELDAEAEARRLDDAQAGDARGSVALPGAAALLAALPPGRWAIVTSGSGRLARARLRAAGLVGPALLVSADDVADGKPDPSGYELAARRLGFAPADCVVVEDSVAGLAAAAAAGMAAIALTTTQDRASLEAAVVVDDLSRLTLRREGSGLLLSAEPPAGRP